MLKPRPDSARTVSQNTPRRSMKKPLIGSATGQRVTAGVLNPTAVGEAFQKWVRHSGLPIAFQGPHCLRHSYAVHLLRRGVSLKTIGDLLGHRTAESTVVYLRLATDDLRRVALPLPRRCPRATRP